MVVVFVGDTKKISTSKYCGNKVNRYILLKGFWFRLQLVLIFVTLSGGNCSSCCRSVWCRTWNCYEFIYFQWKITMIIVIWSVSNELNIVWDQVYPDRPFHQHFCNRLHREAQGYHLDHMDNNYPYRNSLYNSSTYLLK